MNQNIAPNCTSFSDNESIFILLEPKTPWHLMMMVKEPNPILTPGTLPALNSAGKHPSSTCDEDPILLDHLAISSGSVMLMILMMVMVMMILTQMILFFLYDTCALVLFILAHHHLFLLPLLFLLLS